jgi:outer membrane protein
MKLSKIILMSLVAIALVAPASFAEEKAKIGYVDLSRLFDEYHKTKEYDKVLEEKSKAFEKERNDKIEKIKEAQGKLALLADDKKKQMEQDVEKMKAELLEFDRQKKTDLTKERNEKIRDILLEIEKIVSDFAKKEGYSVILNDRVLIYGETGLNLTEQVLKSLNDSQAKK